MQFIKHSIQGIVGIFSEGEEGEEILVPDLIKNGTNTIGTFLNLVHIIGICTKGHISDKQL